jgi:peptide/nickel transport system substrate-binding protein
MPESAIYDENYVPDFNSFMSTFGGVRVVSNDPLVIETYSDAVQPDAENSITTWWPYYDQGTSAWHNLTLGVLAEGEGLAAFSSGKADANEIPWLNMIAGDTVDTLKTKLDEWTASLAIPYEPIMSQYVDEAELTARLANLAAFHEAYGHFTIGTGPFFVEAAFPIEKSLQMTRFADYPYPASRWLGFSEAKIADLAIDGDVEVTIGEEAVFDLTVTFKGDPYPVDEVDSVKFLVLDATQTVAVVGEAEAVADGQWQIVLSAEETAGLSVGANSLEVVVVSKLVAVPTAGSFDFVSIE